MKCAIIFLLVAAAFAAPDQMDDIVGEVQDKIAEAPHSNIQKPEFQFQCSKNTGSLEQCNGKMIVNGKTLLIEASKIYNKKHQRWGHAQTIRNIRRGSLGHNTDGSHEETIDLEGDEKNGMITNDFTPVEARKMLHIWASHESDIHEKKHFESVLHMLMSLRDEGHKMMHTDERDQVESTYSKTATNLLGVGSSKKVRTRYVVGCKKVPRSFAFVQFVCFWCSRDGWQHSATKWVRENKGMGWWIANGGWTSYSNWGSSVDAIAYGPTRVKLWVRSGSGSCITSYSVTNAYRKLKRPTSCTGNFFGSYIQKYCNDASQVQISQYSYNHNYCYYLRSARKWCPSAGYTRCY